MSENSGGDHPPTAVSSDSGGNSRNNSNRNRGRNRHGGNSDRFEGKCEDLKGFVYDVQHSDATESFQKTTQEIAEYISKEYEKAGEFRTALVNLKFEELVEPIISDSDAENKVEVLKYERLVKAYDARVEARTKNEGKAFPLILGQCSPAMRDRLEAADSWRGINAATNVIGLLKLIQTTCATKQSKQEASHTLLEAYRDFFSFRQLRLNNSDYLQAFKDRLDVLERLAGPIGQDDERVLQYYGARVTSGTSHADAKEACREQFIATTFLFGADKQRYGDLLIDMQNEHVISGRPYPATLTDAYNIIVNYKHKMTPRDRNKNKGGSEGMAFLQGEEDDNGDGPSGTGNNTTGGSRKNRGRRSKSNNNKNIKSSKNQGDDKGKESESNANFILQEADKLDNNTRLPPYDVDLRPIEACMANADGKRLPNTWMIMDSASSVDIITNKSFLTDIRTAPKPLTVLCNAGRVDINQQGSLSGYPRRVWYYPNGVANILGLHNVAQHFRVTYDNAKQDAFFLHKIDGTMLVFTPSEKGLYRLDTSTTTGIDISLLATIKDKRSQYDQRGYKQAEMARKVQNIIMRPGLREYLEIVSKGILRNCPIEKRHIQAAEDIFGPNLGALKGKTPRRAVPHVLVDKDAVPPEVLSIHKHITLAIDIMFVNGIAFFVTISRHLRFGTIESLNNRQIGTIKKCLATVIATYQRRGFIVDNILADDEFAPLKQELPGIDINCCGADEHVPEIERYIRTIKDRARSGYNDLPFAYVPRVVLDRLLGNCVFWLNAFPGSGPNALPYSPRYIMLGRHLDFNKHVRCEFGAYAQTHEQHDNTMAPRTVGAICMGPTGNAQGTHFFLSLQTGRLLRRPHWTELPLPADVINRVSELGRRQGMPRSLTFADRYGHELFDHPDDIDDDHDSAYTPTDDTASDDDFSLRDYDPDGDDPDDPFLPPDAVPTPAAGVAANNIGPPGDIAPQPPESDSGSTTNDDGTEEPQDHTDDDSQWSHNEDNVEEEQVEIGPDANATVGGTTPTADLNPQGQPRDNDPQNFRPDTTGVEGRDPRQNTGVAADSEDTTGVEPEETTGVGEAGRMNLRPRQQKNPTHLLGRGFEDAFVFLTEQMSAKAGLKKFGKKGAEAIVTEMEQLHYRNVIQPIHGKDMTREEKRRALQYLMFLKQKRCGKIKARGCADGRKQRVYKTKEETRSPTVRTESLFLSAILDAREGRRVATCDIPGAFMQADMDEVVHVRFDGPLAQLLTRVDPHTYTKFLENHNGKEVMYVRLRKALYGTLQGAMLFWKELTAFLCSELGFKLNPYDDCVANKTIRGRQCTVLWHVDDLKISHVSQAVIDEVLEAINKRFGKETPITITRGRVHDYLGMTLDYSQKGKVVFKMDDFIDRLLEEVPGDMDGVSATPAANHLFQVNKGGVKLDDETAELFHHLVAKLLYLCKRVRPDLHTAVAFLTTRVMGPDADDYKKLARCIRYLRGTRDLCLTLEADEDGKIHWWVDASFAVHPDMKSHTGAALSLGRGAAYTMSTRQKINTKSSTEAELVGVDDAMPIIIWTRNFLKAQGYEVLENTVYQDNQSAILLEKNGRASSGKRTRHVDIRYFFYH